MVKSMFAGVSGLKAHQRKMDVIGNNIANVNTWGYKAYSFNFQDSIYSTSVRSSGGETTAGAYGGRNPSQVGYGSAMSSISFQYTTGAPSPTDNDLDCMIDGTGLFLVGGMVNGQLTTDGIKSSGLHLSRVGIFSVDNNGYLVDDQKNYVYGYALDQDKEPNINGGKGTGIPEKPETKATAVVTPKQVTVTYDATTGEYTLDYLGVKATSTSTNHEELVKEWLAVATDETNGPFKDCTINVNKQSKGSVGANGEFNLSIGVTIIAKSGGTAGNTSIPQGNLGNAANGDFTYTEGTDYVPSVEPEFKENLSPIQIPIDPDTKQPYVLQSYSISDNGVIVGIDTQNRPITLGQLALIAVENPNGLEKTSGYYYNIGDNAGGIEVVKPGSGAAGFIRSKYLEMPNVDLANEFSNMITTQRGFQANSKIITVTDEMLQELVNMKR